VALSRRRSDFLLFVVKELLRRAALEATAPLDKKAAGRLRDDGNRQMSVPSS
jgi:hypothetical protein